MPDLAPFLTELFASLGMAFIALVLVAWVLAPLLLGWALLTDRKPAKTTEPC